MQAGQHDPRENPKGDLQAPVVILASASQARRLLLENAGVSIQVIPASIDEEEIKLALRAEGATAAQAAETLAELKAQRVSRQHANALVIGADQMLTCDGAWFDKPKSIAEAKESLRALGGRQHELISAVSVVQGGRYLWHHVDSARLTLRPLSDAFIDDYLAAAGDDALSSVGAYRIEGLGAQLFSAIEGDYFTILGLPLLPVLDFLRNHKVVAT